MGHLLPYIATTVPGGFVQHTESTSPLIPPTTSINASPRSALLVENNGSLLDALRRHLKDMGYAVRTASNTEEAIRLYRDFTHFNVVLIDYCIPQCNGNETRVDCSIQTAGTELAKTILSIDPSQEIIILAFHFENVADVPRPPELIHLPVVLEISIARLRIALEALEVVRAVRVLTIADQLRLQQVAKFWVRGIGRAAGGRDWQDLFQEAVFRTLLGAVDGKKGRHWNKKVDLVRHLAEAMRSIANSWKRQFSQEESTFLSSELMTCDSEGEECSPLDYVASGHPLVEDRLIEMDEENLILATLRDDTDATQLLEGWMDGLKKNEILRKYGLDEKRYAAAVRRIRIKLLGKRG